MPRIADRTFKAVSALFTADVFRIAENVPVVAWYLLSLETMWALPIRGHIDDDSRFPRVWNT